MALTMDYLQHTTADSATAIANTAVVLTYAAAVGAQRHVVTQIAAGYNVAGAGSLTIQDGSGNVVFQTAILVAGLQIFTWPHAFAGSPNTAMIVTLAAVATAIGTLNVSHLELD